MKIHSACYFKDPAADHQFIEQWILRLEKLNNRNYKRFILSTYLGSTVVLSHNSHKTSLPCLFVFPGFRTSSLFWDLDNGLEVIEDRYRIFLVETNGQPNLSDGNTPDIKTSDYAQWAGEVIDQLTSEKVSVAGASFGGLICLKLATEPEKIQEVFLLNPGCLQPFSLAPKNLYYNLLPIIRPTETNVRRFLDKAVFHAPSHSLSAERMQLIVDYELFALKHHADKAQKPYPMTKAELQRVEVPVHLIVGENDMLFPCPRNIKAAQEGLANLKSVTVIPGTGHGIETSKEAMRAIDSAASKG
ncbi:MAG: alpha/beta hydrolase [Bacteroidota bacterium]